MITKPPAKTAYMNIMIISTFIDKDDMMRRNYLVIGTVLAIIVIAIFIIYQLNANVPPLNATIALQTLVTIPGRCDSFNSDWSLVAGSGII